MKKPKISKDISFYAKKCYEYLKRIDNRLLQRNLNRCINIYVKKYRGRSSDANNETLFAIAYSWVDELWTIKQHLEEIPRVKVNLKFKNNNKNLIVLFNVYYDNKKHTRYQFLFKERVHFLNKKDSRKLKLEIIRCLNYFDRKGA